MQTVIVCNICYHSTFCKNNIFICTDLNGELFNLQLEQGDRVKSPYCDNG